MTRYYDLTESQKLALSANELQAAIELEAIHRGIKPPIKLSDILNQHPYVGYTTPEDAVTFYEVTRPSEYGGWQGTGLAFKTEAEAVKASQNGICIHTETYQQTSKILAGEFGVRVVKISLTKQKTFAAKIEDYGQDDTDFNNLAEECMKEIGGIHQRDYDQRVNAEKKANYLRLAQGNEEIAKAFWAKTERCDWPETTIL